MTETVVAPNEPKAGRGTWRLSWRGLRLITELELKQRVRSTKWKWALAAFVAIVGVVTLLLSGAMNVLFGVGENGGTDDYDVLFGVVVFFVLGLGLLVSPTLSATAINGDSKEGTLAPLQATALSSVDIVVGKLIGAWVASLAFLVVSLPFIIFAFVLSDAPLFAVLTTVLVLALELLVVCAIGLGWSAVTSRTPASAVLTYVTVACLTVISLILFGLTIPLVNQPTTVRIYDAVNYDDITGNATKCAFREETFDQAHTERTWWLLAMNPFVIVADAAPSNDDLVEPEYGYSGRSSQTMLGSIKYAVREARMGPRTVENWCYMGDGYDLLPEEEARLSELSAQSPIWPYGLAFHTLLAGGALWLAVRRVDVPHGKLASGTRVA
jgi:ABC-type transport system involved in multi-copper enzyme maturation permease subunit